MVKRLIEQDDLDSVDAQLAELFRAAAPFQADAARKRRVLVLMEGGAARRAPRFWLRPMVVAALFVSGSAAAFGHRYLARGNLIGGWFGDSSSSPSDTSRPVLAMKRQVSRPPEPNSTPEPSAQTEPAPAPSAPEAQVSPARPSAKSVVRPHPEAAEDATHVVEAIQALRKQKDPARAQGLLDEYLDAHPRGVLSADALALSIEAASARHDPRAADYARRYLASYPKGKYRDLAIRALEAQR